MQKLLTELFNIRLSPMEEIEKILAGGASLKKQIL